MKSICTFFATTRKKQPTTGSSNNRIKTDEEEQETQDSERTGRNTSIRADKLRAALKMIKFYFFVFF